MPLRSSNILHENITSYKNNDFAIKRSGENRIEVAKLATWCEERIITRILMATVWQKGNTESEAYFGRSWVCDDETGSQSHSEGGCLMHIAGDNTGHTLKHNFIVNIGIIVATQVTEMLPLTLQ